MSRECLSKDGGVGVDSLDSQGVSVAEEVGSDGIGGDMVGGEGLFIASFAPFRQ
jgi:hypothetical protein